MRKKSSNGILSLDQRILMTLEKLRISAGFSKKEFLDIVQYKSETYKKISLGQSKLELSALRKASDTFEVSMDQIISGDIDFCTVERQFKINPNEIPQKYSNSKVYFTSARPIVASVKWIDALFGPMFSEILLRKIQVRSAYFSSHQMRVHPILISDFFMELEKFGVHPSQAFEIGKISRDLDAKSEVGTTLSQAKSIRDLYRFVHDGILASNFDQMFDYVPLRVRDNKVTLKAIPKKQSYEQLQVTSFGHRPLCLYRQGVYVGFAGHLTKALPIIKESACVYSGDNHCIFHIEWKMT